MADVVDQSTRSRMMSGIRGRNTKPELSVRRFLHAKGFRFRLHAANLPGKPDIVLTKYRTVVLVHGCYWHQHPGCRYAVMPKTNTPFWEGKLRENQARDARNLTKLKGLGWQPWIIWECDVNNHRVLEDLVNQIKQAAGVREG